MNIRFTTKILLITVIPLITTSIILSSILISDRIKEFNARINEKGENLVNYLSPISEFGIFSSNFSYMESTLRQSVNQDNIAAIYINDRDGDILAIQKNSHYEPLDLKSIPFPYQTFTAQIYPSKTIIDDMDITQMDQIMEPSPIGSVNLIMSLSEANATREKIIKDGFFISLISTVITIIAALYFSKTITRPIEHIRHGVSNIKKGILSYRIPVTYTGEIAELAKNINDMSSAIEIAQLKQKQKSEDALFIEKTKAQITLEAIGEGVITTDTNGNITYINPAASFLTGYTLQAALNLPLTNVFRLKHQESGKMEAYPINECIEHTRKIHHETGFKLVSRDGTEHSIRETATPLLDKDKNVVGAVIVFYDFSQINKIPGTVHSGDNQ